MHHKFKVQDAYLAATDKYKVELKWLLPDCFQ